MNIINIDIGGFIFALDRGGIFIRVPWVGEAWLDFTGNGLSHFDRAGARSS